MLLFFEPYIGYSTTAATYITQVGSRYDSWYHALSTSTALLTNRFGDGVVAALTSDNSASFDARTHFLAKAKPTTGTIIRAAVDVYIGSGVVPEPKQIFSFLNKFETGIFVASGIVFSQAATVFNTLTYNPNNTISLYVNGTAVATSVATAPQQTHFRIEVEVDLQVSGRYRVWLAGNSTPIIDYSGNVTRGLSTADVYLTHGNYLWVYIGMVAIWDDAPGGAFTGYMGDFRPVRLLPNGAGSSSQSTPVGVANRHDAVDDAFRNGATDYVTFNANGQKDLYTYTDLEITGDILTVIVEPACWKSGVGNASLKIECRSSGIDSSSDAKPIVFESQAAQAAHEFPVDPATGVAWTQSGLNAAEFGVSVVM